MAGSVAVPSPTAERFLHALYIFAQVDRLRLARKSFFALPLATPPKRGAQLVGLTGRRQRLVFADGRNTVDRFLQAFRKPKANVRENAVECWAKTLSTVGPGWGGFPSLPFTKGSQCLKIIQCSPLAPLPESPCTMVILSCHLATGCSDIGSAAFQGMVDKFRRAIERPLMAWLAGDAFGRNLVGRQPLLSTTNTNWCGRRLPCAGFKLLHHRTKRQGARTRPVLRRNARRLAFSS